MRYIILNNDKTPSEKLSDGGHLLKEVQDFDNLAVLVPKPYVVFDFDTVTDAKIMLQIAKALELKCLIMQTTRGYHFWFKNPEPMKNSVKTKSAIGLFYDVRSYGKLSYTVVKRDGKWRDWIQTVPDDEIEDVPLWLKPTGSKYKFKGMKAGDGRNTTLFEYVLVLQTKGFNRGQIRQTLRIINEFVFDEPLSKSELDVILRDESFKPDDEIKEQVAMSECFTDDGKFLHNKFAELLVKEMDILTVHEQCYIYKDGYYQRAERDIDKEMISRYRRIKKAQRTETIDYIKILTTKKAEELPKDDYIINLQNGRLDVRTHELLSFDPSVPEFAQMPVKYDPSAYSEVLDKMLDKVFCNDTDVRMLFEEMIGYMLIKNCRFRKGFLLYGSGSNGKSTVLNMIKAFLGEDNLATIELNKLGETFMAAELENKLANIGDDIDPRDIKDTGIIKKLFTGESMSVQRKYEQPFTMRSYAKLVFSCNELPRILDKSHGMYSRLTFIPFQAIFSSKDSDYDPFIEDKVTTPESLSYLLNLALVGLNRLLANNRFTNPEKVEKVLETYRSENSTVLTWIDDEGITVEDLLSNFTDKLFSDFQDWCTRSGIKYQSSIRTMHKEIENQYNFDRKRVRNNETGGKYKWQFVVKLEI